MERGRIWRGKTGRGGRGAEEIKVLRDLSPEVCKEQCVRQKGAGEEGEG